jgi:hypothetical protein
MMNNDKQYKALEALDCSYDLFKEIQSVIFSGESNANDTSWEQGFYVDSPEWYAVYTATVSSVLDAEPHSKECLQFFEVNQ